MFYMRGDGHIFLTGPEMGHELCFLKFQLLYPLSNNVKKVFLAAIPVFASENTMNK